MIGFGLLFLGILLLATGILSGFAVGVESTKTLLFMIWGSVVTIGGMIILEIGDIKNGKR